MCVRSIIILLSTFNPPRLLSSPSKRISELVPVEQTKQPAIKIMSRTVQDRIRAQSQSRTGSVNGEDAESSDVEPSEAGSLGGRSSAPIRLKKGLTLEEREAAYIEARSRIFLDFEKKAKEKDNDMSASSSTHSVLSRVRHLPAEAGAVARVILMIRLVLLRPRVSFLALLCVIPRASGEMDLEQTPQAHRDQCSPTNIRPALVDHALRHPRLPTPPSTILPQMLSLTMRAGTSASDATAVPTAIHVSLPASSPRARSWAGFRATLTVLFVWLPSATPDAPAAPTTTPRIEL